VCMGTLTEQEKNDDCVNGRISKTELLEFHGLREVTPND
jgi:hypothetical protein